MPERRAPRVVGVQPPALDQHDFDGVLLVRVRLADECLDCLVVEVPAEALELRHEGDIRLQLGLSQARFATRSGDERALVGQIERGERNLTLRSVERLSALLQVDPRISCSPTFNP